MKIHFKILKNFFVSVDKSDGFQFLFFFYIEWQQTLNISSGETLFCLMAVVANSIRTVPCNQSLWIEIFLMRPGLCDICANPALSNWRKCRTNKVCSVHATSSFKLINSRNSSELATAPRQDILLDSPHPGFCHICSKPLPCSLHHK